MTRTTETESRKLLQSLRDVLAGGAETQTRLDQVVSLIAASFNAEVCSLYLMRDENTLELYASHGLDPSAVHNTRMRLGEGLVGRVAKYKRLVNTSDAPGTPGFRYMAETREERFSSMLGVPIQRLGQVMGTLVVQTKDARTFSDDEVYGVEVVAMVLAEMAELGAIVDDSDSWSQKNTAALTLHCGSVQEGLAKGHVYLHEPRVMVTNPVADDPETEAARLEAALEEMRVSVDLLLARAKSRNNEEQAEVIEAYRMFTNSKGWRRRLDADIARGMSAEAAVEKEQSQTRARMEQIKEPYLRERMHDLDDLSNKLLRILTGQGEASMADLPDDAILLARNIGPAELLEYGTNVKAIVLEEGSVGSHASIVARTLAIPMVINASNITAAALSGDKILVDADDGWVHLRPDEMVTTSFDDKMAMAQQAQNAYASLRHKPAISIDGQKIDLLMNAGLMANLPTMPGSGAEGVGLFRTELQFLTTNTLPNADQLTAQYKSVLKAAGGKRVVFRTLDVGSDKVLPYMKPEHEPNPAMGWRAIRLALDKPGVIRMQLQALMRAAAGQTLTVMFPFVAQYDEFAAARAVLERAKDREQRLGHDLPAKIELGAMIETPSLAFATDRLFQEADFMSIGGNDLKQFFFAADRENERVRQRYDTLNISYLTFLEHIANLCKASNTKLSFCGEDAGKPLEALCFAAMGVTALSMRSASIGPIKHAIRHTNLRDLKAVIDKAKADGAQSVRPAVADYVKGRF
ncbi:MAG: phosphoenolpyruvate--protein phosphotransferase [Planktomarina sp.]